MRAIAAVQPKFYHSCIISQGTDAEKIKFPPNIIHFNSIHDILWKSTVLLKIRHLELLSSVVGNKFANSELLHSVVGNPTNFQTFNYYTARLEILQIPNLELLSKKLWFQNYTGTCSSAPVLQGTIFSFAHLRPDCRSAPRPHRSVV